MKKQKQSEPKNRVEIHIPQKLHDQLRAAAAEHGVSVAVAMVNLLRGALAAKLPVVQDTAQGDAGKGGGSGVTPAPMTSEARFAAFMLRDTLKDKAH